jgi:OOP family OmpA-OmpF porin
MKKLITISLLSLSLFGLDKGWEVGIGTGYIQSNEDGKTNTHSIQNIKIGKYLPKNNLIRLDLEHSKYENVNRASINIEHDFNIKSSKLTPYILTGIGRERNSHKNKSSTVVDLGVGSKYSLTKKINLFAEGKAAHKTSNNKKQFTLLTGINYEFGNSDFDILDNDNDGVNNKLDKCPNTPKDIRVDMNGCPLDFDKDGIPNYKDKCPNTPKGVEVNENGCPIDSDKDGIPNYWDECPNTPKGVKVLSNGCPVIQDSDSDGINDDIDKCPNTPEGIKVDLDGCAIDSDKDGIADYLDECSNTPKNVVVNATGCPLTYNFNIHFKSNNNMLNLRNMESIVKFAKFLKDNPAYNARIEGYTDNQGSPTYNLELSQKRAKAVYTALIKLGINPNRLSYKGYGEENNIASNSTEEGRKLNRRVVAKLFFNKY